MRKVREYGKGDSSHRIVATRIGDSVEGPGTARSTGGHT